MTDKEFLRRRQALLSYMAPSSVVLIFAAPIVIRSHTSTYPYRQNSDFWYFTGFNESEAALLLIKISCNNDYSVLFNRRNSLQNQIWCGNYLGQKDALKTLSVNYALPWDCINDELYHFLQNITIVYHAQGQYDFADRIVLHALNQIRHQSLTHTTSPITLLDWRPWVRELRLLKSQEEQRALREAGRISALAHQSAIKIARPDMYEYQLEGEIQRTFHDNGARFPAYNTIIASGENACILHYTNNDQRMYAGQLVLIDAGCEFKGYAADVTRTVPVNGTFSTPQRAIYNIVLDAITLGLKLYRPGTTIYSVTQAVVRMMVKRLIQLNIIQGDLDTLISTNAIHPFFMHKLSHWIGLDVHDVGGYGENDHRVLKPGMTLTIEPGLYISKRSHVPKEYRGIGVRIEDDILITKDGNENFTASVVKETNAIEHFMMTANIP
ncbi:Xaa-Pro aminopeptidase [Candidatus Erwinia haradaeae]|uniref:Xaa-Pro aminopeptidase n=1 Tax=Candidatus Erwinia haradaeae TaxID=1922217 RepID=A0A451DDT8_9GAMM|nr:Xaa-Pro aminopeptidase [Candidatus Erwinia haradaeae]VFP84568.1 Xaa-Pro aminopeptidase [Candidatus Erwinia haradaeae]